MCLFDYQSDNVCLVKDEKNVRMLFQVIPFSMVDTISIVLCIIFPNFMTGYVFIKVVMRNKSSRGD